jgi:hypothetical protein
MLTKHFTMVGGIDKIGVILFTTITNGLDDIANALVH